jgi:hypothetical protein
VGRLGRDLAPVGILEEMVVEKIAVCWWRQKRALRCEAGLVGRALAEYYKRRQEVENFLRRRGHEQEADSRQDETPDHLSLPEVSEMDRILRYETTIQRQLAHAINQLERLQRARKGEHVPAPVHVQVLSGQ